MWKTPMLLVMRVIFVTFRVVMVVGALCFSVACTNGGSTRSSATAQDGYPAPFKEWQIIDTATGQPVSLDQWTALLFQQDIIYLGEEHHNRFHIDAAMMVLQKLKADGRTPALAMEMFGWDGQAALDQYVSGLEISRQEFLVAVRWRQNWGGPFEDYEPLVRLAKEHHWTLDAMNPPKPLVRIVAKNGLAQAESDPMMAQWGMKDEAIVDDPIYRARILEQLQACHGKGDDSLYQTMLDASMFRDEGMAKTVAGYLARQERPSTHGPLVSYTGGGHIQYYVPVPNRVRRRSHDVKQMTIYLTALSGDQRDEVMELLRSGIADYIWLTPIGAHGPAKRCK